MKSAPINLGNINCKGKKTVLLSCRCCEAQDFRQRELIKEINKEIKNYVPRD